MLTQKHSCALHQAYRDVLDRFKSAAGLREDAMLDVRGNHDAFDIPDRYSSNSNNTQSTAMTMTTGKHSHAASRHDTNNVCLCLQQPHETHYWGHTGMCAHLRRHRLSIAAATQPSQTYAARLCAQHTPCTLPAMSSGCCNSSHIQTFCSQAVCKLRAPVTVLSFQPLIRSG